MYEIRNDIKDELKTHGNLYPTGFSGHHPRAEGPDPRVERPCWRRFESPVAPRPVSRAKWRMVAPPSPPASSARKPPKKVKSR